MDVKECSINAVMKKDSNKVARMVEKIGFDGHLHRFGSKQIKGKVVEWNNDCSTTDNIIL